MDAVMINHPGPIVKAKREAMKLEVADVAIMTGLSKALIWKIEAEETDNCRMKTITAFCNALGIHPMEFFNVKQIEKESVNA